MQSYTRAHNMKRNTHPTVLVVSKTPDCQRTISNTTMISSECYNFGEYSEMDFRSLTRQRVLEHRVTSQAKELGALRHVLERLKGAVFHCDAQNTALQVALKKQQSPQPRKSEMTSKTELCKLRETLVLIMIKVKELENEVKIQTTHSPQLKNDVGRLTTINEVGFVTKAAEELENMKKQYKKAEEEWDQERLCLLDEINSRQLDCEEQETELRLIEAERIRLAIQENKMTECLKLLQNLKLMNFPKRTLGKILVDSLDNCKETNSTELEISKFIDTFYEILINYDLEVKESLLPLALNINI